MRRCHVGRGHRGRDRGDGTPRATRGARGVLARSVALDRASAGLAHGQGGRGSSPADAAVVVAQWSELEICRRICTRVQDAVPEVRVLVFDDMGFAKKSPTPAPCGSASLWCAACCHRFAILMRNSAIGRASSATGHPLPATVIQRSPPPSSLATMSMRSSSASPIGGS